MLIAIDHGNYAVKTPHFSFISGLTEHTVKPPMAEEVLEYNGKYWSLTGQRLPYMRDKTRDDRYFILSLFAIAKELSAAGANTAFEQIDLAVGLPPEHYGMLRERFAQYFRRFGTVNFAYNNRPMSIVIRNVFVYPQAYAAVVPQSGQLYLSVQRAWHSEHNRPVISSDLKTKSARRDIPLPSVLTECLQEAKEVATSEYVVANRDGDPLSYTQFKRVWQYIVTRSTKERTYVRYINGQKIQRTVTPKLGEKAAHNGNVVYTLDFQVTPHQLRHTYITNLIYSGADPKTVQYLAGHKHSKITMDIYAKVKYNKPKELSSVVNKAFAPKKGATPNKTRNG